MARNNVFYFLTQALFILKVSSQGQSVKQYYLTRVGPQQQPGLPKIPAFNPKQPNIPNVSGQQYFIPGPTFAVSPPEMVPGPRMSSNTQFLPTGLSSIPPMSQFISTASQNSALSSMQQMPCQNQGLPQSLVPGPAKLLPPTLPTPMSTSPTESPTSNPPVMDTHVLNNLAIALQLLIVNNILNKPLPDPTSAKSPFESLRSLLPNSSPIPELPSQSLPYPNEYGSISYNQYTPMPNANFLGGSSLSGTSSPMLGMTGFKPPARSSLTLMSPYEALGPNSPFSDPILSSQYAPTSSQSDFQSPYAAILSDNKDLFSMVDLY